uniref:Peptidase_M13 domain-containing protein n=1 Tax=Panagrellus redivivus TaxID=6233 RepID=A0A7E4VGA5_PANRE
MTELNKTTDADLLRYIVFQIIVKNVKEVHCLKLLTSLPLITSRIYTESKYATTAERKSVQNKVDTMIKSIKKNMKAMVLSMPWIKKDKRAYNALVKKFDKMRYEVAIEAVMLNNTWLDKYYKQIQFDDGDTFYDMRSKLLKFELYGKVRQLLYKQVDFEDDLTMANAKFMPILNKFVIYDGYLTAPNYHKKYLDSYNWGSVGFICAHEIGHSVDSNSITYNASGLYENFFRNSTEQELNKMTSCVVEEYDKIQVLPGNYTPNHVNGQLTLTENLADATGLEAAYRAFKDFTRKNPKEKRLRHPKLRGLTRDQLFFLGSVQFYCEKQADSFVEYMIENDPHSPNKARAEGTLPNVPALGKAFKCPVGSKYRPVKHCNVWTH